MSIEERRYAVGDVELRADDDEHGPVAFGHAAVFGRRSHDLGGFTELVDRSAFNKTITEADVVALWNHNEDRLLGRIVSGTLRLEVDDRGLAYEIDMPDHEAGLVDLLRRRDIRGSSFGFRTIRDSWEIDDEGNVTRTLLEVALIDVSPVARPAYPDTDAALRSLASHVHRDLVEVRAALSAHDLAPLLTPQGAEKPPIAESIEWLYA